MSEPSAHLSLAVLASSSSGNASVLRVVDRAGRLHYFALDAGLSPKRTLAAYGSLGVQGQHVAGVLVTHLDADHWHAGWLAAMPDQARVHLHSRHLSRAERLGVTYLRTNVLPVDETGKPGHAFGTFDLCEGVRVRWILNDHDDHGSVSYRVDHCSGASVGFVTDLGVVSAGLVQLMRGVSVLAVESNYCPRMQQASTRPAFLKERIMGGRGHLSNEQSAAFVRAVQPRDALALLHLSRECNTPETVLVHHQHDVATYVTSPDSGTPWLDATSRSSDHDESKMDEQPVVAVRTFSGQGMLFRP
jgi:phosphoribosyl 1,2-cyclic phosphodiesterase